MPYVITSTCIGTQDQSCVEVCPVTAIFPLDSVPPEEQHFIDLNALWYRDPDTVRAQVDEMYPPA